MNKNLRFMLVLSIILCMACACQYASIPLPSPAYSPPLFTPEPAPLAPEPTQFASGADQSDQNEHRAVQTDSPMPKEDIWGNAYIRAASLESSELLGWSTTGYSDQYTFHDYIEKFIPQAWDRPLYVQDICDRYIPEPDELYQYDLDKKSLEQLYEDIDNADFPDRKYVERNLKFIKQYIEKKANIYDGRIGKTIKLDLDNDGTMEKISIQKRRGRKVPYDVGSDEVVQFYTFSIQVNDTVALEIEREDAKITFLDLETCRVLIVQPLGFFEGYGWEYAYTYKEPAYVYQYINDQYECIGIIQGQVDLVLGMGRFTTIGFADTFPHNDGPVYEVVREYFIKEGETFQIYHEWQFSRTLWNVNKELPIYEDMNGTVSEKTIPAGSKVMVVSYSPDGWLLLLSDKNIRGYIKITLDEEGYWEMYAYAMPGDEPMELYFDEYGGVAG